MTLEQIAQQDGVKLSAVQTSIRQIGLYYDLSTEQEMQAMEIGVVMACTEAQKKALLGALDAKKPIFSEEGKVIDYIPDWNVQLEAVAKINEKMEALQPKGRGGVNIQTNVGVGVNHNEAGAGGGTFEERLREIQKRRGTIERPALPASMASVEEEGEEVILEGEIVGSADTTSDGGADEAERPIPE